MKTPVAIPTPFAGGASTIGQPRFIELAIRGKNLVLAGKFDHWIAMELESGGKESEARLLFDVTSTGGPANDSGEVFSFLSNDVQRKGAGTYLAKGLMRRGELEGEAEAIVQAPAAHSPFSMVTFRMDEEAFPEVWSELSARVAAQDGANLEVRPRAWLFAPSLAAA